MPSRQQLLQSLRTRFAAGERPLTAIRSRFGVDERALAAFRVTLAVAVLLDVVLALQDVRAFYTDAGIVPRSLLYTEFPVFGRLSLHALSGALWWQLILFALTAVAAVAFAVGYRSRLAALATFVLVLSMQARNPFVLNAGHSLLRRLLLWSVLLPIGARWSVDAAMVGREGGELEDSGSASTSRPASNRDDGRASVASLATAGVLVQVFVVYAVNAVVKAKGVAWRDGTAVRRVFGMDALTVRLGDVLAGHATLLELGTHAWVALLVCTPLLFLAAGRVRAVVASALAVAHLGMAATLALGVFPLVSFAGVLLFLPPFVWDEVDVRLPSPALEAPSALDRFRRRLGSREGVPSGGVPARRIRQIAPAILLAVVLIWNAAGLGLIALPATVTDTVDPQERRWDMFAPNPLSTGGWYETVGVTTGGERVDAYAGTAGNGPPDDVDATYPSQRWYLYLRHIRGNDAAASRERFGEFLCERWTRTHDSSLERVTVTFVANHVRLDAPNDREREPIGTTNCTA